MIASTFAPMIFVLLAVVLVAIAVTGLLFYVGRRR